ncbi:hypothetical protein Q2T40_12340 [Winogradskyella maritima]|uniref:Uncharacterized protein n=1 Tax=Winogradskyella maritima TaxID=1517766 RepID=A0ABV8AKN3_9FLAO|nr:hypothetical protein [Winogradskyella maritima]
MILKRTNIEERLQKQRSKSHSPNILEQVDGILAKDHATETRIFNQVTNGASDDANSFNFDLLDTNNIYHIDDIKAICISYRLRFLDSKYFKADLPYEAISKIKQLEKDHNTELKGFKIVAPSKLFKLENYDDPLFFAPMGNGYYYLIHKWGNDLSPVRKWLMKPYKNFENLIVATLLISLLTTIAVPFLFMNGEASPAQFWMIFFFIFKCYAAIVLYYGFAAGKNFNDSIWNSRYFNA